MHMDDLCWYSTQGTAKDLQAIKWNQTDPDRLLGVETRMDMEEKQEENFIDTWGLSDASCQFLIHSITHISLYIGSMTLIRTPGFLLSFIIKSK